MKKAILEFLDEQIAEGEKLKDTVNSSQRDTVCGALQAFHEVYEFIEEYEEDE